MFKKDENGAKFRCCQYGCKNLAQQSIVSIGNYTVREVLMKNRTRVWRNVYNTASA